ncbi:MAG TPA: caspase family protein [Polyangiaceae bacterium]|nr:caspase family protein [Polyangiaceae bacterium]
MAQRRSPRSRPTAAIDELDELDELDEEGGPAADLLPGPIGKRYALLVGANRYEDRRLRELKYAVSDVRRLAEALRAYGYEVEALHDVDDPDRRPTCENVMARLEAMVAKAGHNDLLLVHFSCHGKMNGDETSLLLADTRWQKDAFRPVVPIAGVKRALSRGRSRRAVLMFDACQAGGGGREVIDPGDHARFLRNAYLNASGLAVLASCSEGQIAHEPDSLGHGVFTYHVLEGLRRAAVDPATGLVTVGGLAAYVGAKLREWWEREGVEFQRPDLELQDADLALADRARVTSPEALWRLTKEVRRFVGHTKAVRRVAPSPDGRRVLTASDDGTARLWDVETGAPAGSPFVHDAKANASTPTTFGGAKPAAAPAMVSAAFQRGGAWVVTLCSEAAVKVWDLETGGFIYTTAPLAPCYDVAPDPTGRYLALASENGVALWMEEPPDENLDWDLRLDIGLLGHKGAVQALAFSFPPDSDFLLATAGYDGRVLVRDFISKRLLHVCAPPEGAASGPLHALAFSPDGKRLAAAGGDSMHEGLRNVPRVWDPSTGKLLFALEGGHTRAVTAVAFSPDGRLLLTTSLDGTACFWDASRGKLIEAFDGPGVAVTSGTFVAGGESVVLGYDDGTLLRLPSPTRPAAKAAAPKAKAGKAEAPRAKAGKAEAPKAKASKAEAPRAKAGKAEAPKAKTGKAATPKAKTGSAAAPKAKAHKAAAAKATARKGAARKSA